MKKRIKLSTILFSALGLILIGGIVQAATVTCGVANFRYGSSAITAYAKTEGLVCSAGSVSPKWDNYLRALCIGWQNKNGNIVREDGGIKEGYDVSSVESRIWVNWGKGSTYTNSYYGSCNKCGYKGGADNKTFNFAN